ncbi:hypothetical protein QUB68_03950 [Microcoleus sp. A006_D1]|uniref:hypothetical protein n=1 Tax=Microcoleus sp. A006_D1 TaxID=3055267 RepID=UPI002FD6A630
MAAFGGWGDRAFDRFLPSAARESDRLRVKSAIAQGLRNRVSSPNLGEDVQILAETRFLAFAQRLRNRVSSQNLGEDAQILAETRFLAIAQGLRKQVNYD